jgi:ribosomal protein S11
MEEEKVETKEEVQDIEEQEEISRKLKKRNKERKEERRRVGIVYVFGSPNNTVVHITDLAGNTISRISGGMVTKHSRLKSNPTIAMFVAKKAA